MSFAAKSLRFIGNLPYSILVMNGTVYDDDDDDNRSSVANNQASKRKGEDSSGGHTRAKRNRYISIAW